MTARKPLIALFSLLMAVMVPLGGCATQMAGGGAGIDIMPQSAPHKIYAAEVVVDSTYSYGTDTKDVSSTFAIPPDEALRRYAEGGIAAAGGSGIFHFVIEDARVYHKLIEQENKVARLVQAGRFDQYEVSVKVRLYRTDNFGVPDGTKATISFLRTVSMPESVSLAERDQRQSEFMRTLIADVDKAVAQAVQDRFGGDVLATP